MAATDIDGARGAGTASARNGLARLHARVPWLAGVGAVLVVLVTSLLIWGPEMGFPTTVSESVVPTSGARTITLDRTVREVTGDTIDDAVDWLTREGDWLFDGVSDAIAYSLVNIEDVLKWVPWPAIVVGLALLSFAVGRWTLLAFTSLALLYIGFMDLWENAVDTIALILVAVVISLAIGLPLGVIGARSRIGDNLMRPILDAMQTMPSFVYLLPGILFFGLGKPAGIFATVIYAVPAGHPAHQSRHSPGFAGGGGGRSRLRLFPVAGAEQGPDPDGAAHDHGGHQPDHADGAGDGDHRQHGRGRRPRRQRAAGAAEEPVGQRPDGRPRDRLPRHYHRSSDTIHRFRREGTNERRLTGRP